jgi:predicted Fe-Mo cluster-binding NifX family protein
MRIAIPTEGKRGLEEKVAYHFGRCETYTILDEKGKLIEVIDNESEHTGGSGLPPELLKRHGVLILLCQGLGPRAVGICESMGIEVYVGEGESAKEMFGLWKAGKLKKATMEDVCEEHSG